MLWCFEVLKLIASIALPSRNWPFGRYWIEMSQQKEEIREVTGDQDVHQEVETSSPESVPEGTLPDCHPLERDCGDCVCFARLRTLLQMEIPRSLSLGLEPQVKSRERMSLNVWHEWLQRNSAVLELMRRRSTLRRTSRIIRSKPARRELNLKTHCAVGFQ
ncbi:hypothetical protein BDZ45DRAFT_449014 [Acephala macrosclerotiorum]|nr:hypothetical protein BDZ45DRAFT_449014 [Acephala macrosclerotiorum]